MLGRVELEPIPDVKAECIAWIERLRPAKLHRIFYAPDGLSKATALAIARELNIPTKPLNALVEVDLGLWAGLTEEETAAALGLSAPTVRRECRFARALLAVWLADDSKDV